MSNTTAHIASEKSARKFVLADSLKSSPRSVDAYPRSQYDDAEQISRARKEQRPQAETSDLLASIRAAKALIG